MFHLSVKPISRAAGRSATAAAAYRSGSEIVDLRTGEVHDYTRKGDIVHSEILVPAGSPAWAADRTALWNAAEAAEKRKDARVARDYEVAIPKDLTRAQGIEAVRDFSAALVDRYGVAVDFNVHRDDLRKWDGSEKGWQGYHAHVLTSTRRLGREGFGEKAEPELSDAKRKSLGLEDGAAEIARVRELWEVVANRHLEQANQAQRIDSRSLKDQGIDREPTIHLGPHVTALERDGIASRLGDINRQAMAGHDVRLEDERAVARLRDETEQGLAVPDGRRKRGQGAVLGKNRQTGGPEKREGEVSNEFGDLSPQAIDAAVKQAMAGLVAERDLRVQRVLGRAQKRQARRDKAYRTIERQQPAAPKGLLRGFQQKGHQQAVAAWESARKAAAKLAEQARKLAERLLEASGARRLLAWSQDVLRRHQPKLVTRYEQLQAERAPAQEEKSKPAEVAKQTEAKPELSVRSPARDELPPASSPAGRASSTDALQGDLRASGATDLKGQAAEGVAAFRERMKARRQGQPDRIELEKAKAEREFERLKEMMDVPREKGAAPGKGQEQERQPKPRDKSRDGPEYE